MEPSIPNSARWARTRAMLKPPQRRLRGQPPPFERMAIEHQPVHWVIREHVGVVAMGMAGGDARLGLLIPMALRPALMATARDTGVLPAGLAVCAWLTLNPYPLWGNSLPLIAAGGVTFAIAIAAQWSGGRLRWGLEALAFTLLAIFLLYVTALPKMEGGHIKWIYVLPTLFALAVFSDERRRSAFVAFRTIFALTLVPAIVVSLWIAFGGHIQFDTLPFSNPAMAAHGASYLTVPGVLLVEGNRIFLPSGGALFRLSAVYDEPGMVGTVAALLLSADRFRLQRWQNLVLLSGGILSFSLAFCLLATVGFVVRAIALRSPGSLAAATLAGLAGLLATGHITFSVPVGHQTGITITATPPVTKQPVASTDAPAPVVKTLTTGPSQLRQTQFLNNRSLPPMQTLVSDYRSSDLRTLLIGMGTDASVIRGGVSQTYKRLFTDFGIIGFTLLLGGCAGFAVAAWQRSGHDPWLAFFLLLFAASVYQRPIVWIPYALMILVGGTAQASSSAAARQP